ncbi:MAG TPA: LamG-like jellyroll fold domain-containing protein, partial [Methanosarcinales archaeon]|nr:LamG-like jellyroll fold domain-containing protein [Methanosarcinales archaeon]
VLYAEFSPLGLVNIKNFFTLYQDSSNRLGFYTRNNNQLWAFMNSSGVAQFDMSTGTTVSVGSVYKVAFAYKVNDVSIFVNGIEVMADASVNMPSSLSQFTFNLQQLSGAFGAEMIINQAQLYKTRLTNTELATLTTI